MTSSGFPSCRYLRALLACYFLLADAPTAVIGSWWYLGLGLSSSSPAAHKSAHSRGGGVNYRVRCSQIENEVLAEHQRELCNQYKSLLDVVSRGAALAIDECQYQFRNSRWNCPTFNVTNVFGNVLKRNSREKAYIFAISSAGIMYAVIKACAKGLVPTCSCDVTASTTALRRSSDFVASDNERDKAASDFEWGGCSHDIPFGDKFTREFVDENENWLTEDGSLNMWNNGAGRKAVGSLVRLLCKCHGISGSCSSKICWRAVSSFRKIGHHLKDKYDGASLVQFNPSSAVSNRPSGATRTRTAQNVPKLLRPVNRRQKRPTASDLVYTDTSPDYCDPDSDTGSVGTAGRLCNRTSHGTDGCTLMCCGRGYKTLVETITEECNCVFVWCCRVDCEQCSRSHQKHYCN